LPAAAAAAAAMSSSYMQWGLQITAIWVVLAACVVQTT
jgi:hypothetical protein